MSEVLHIKNFGPIKDVKLELMKFNVIIGENATGKSTVAKVIAMCRYFSFIIQNDYKSVKTNYIDNDNFLQGFESWGLQESYKNDGKIEYFNEDYSFEIELKVDNKLPLIDKAGNQTTFRHISSKFNLKPKSEKFKTLLNEFNALKLNNDSMGDNWRIPTSFFQNDVSRVMNNPFYIPTERGLQSIFSLGKNSIQNISDALFNQFANIHSIARNFSSETLIEPLDIYYKNIDGKGFFKKSNEDEFYSLYNGASGYKSLIPVILVIKYYNEIRKKNKTFLIEEPELNLFPQVQQKFVNYLIAETFGRDNQVLLTTHSPYILTSLNNLMYAYQVGKNHKKEVGEIIEEKYWVNPKDVSCYFMKDGGVESIMNYEEGMINAEFIDSVSTELNKDFDKLIDIEIAENAN